MIIKLFETKKVSYFFLHQPIFTYFLVKLKKSRRTWSSWGEGERERERERERIRVFKNSYRTKGSYFVRPDADPFSVVRVADARRTLGAEGEFVDLRSEVEHVFDARLHGGKKILFFVRKEGEKKCWRA